MISEQLNHTIYQPSLFGVSDFPAKISPLQENKREFGGDVQGFSGKLYGCLKGEIKKIDPNGCSLKMLKIYCLLDEVLTLPDCSVRWEKSGTSANGKCLTVKTLEFRKTGKGCSLLDILEKEVDEKYFLSDQQTAKILANSKNPCKQQELTKGVADAFRIYDSRGLARTLKAEGGELGSKTGLYLVPVKISKKSGTPVNNMKIKNVGAQTASCLSARYYKGLSEDNCNGILCIQKTRRKIRCRIRKLTPRECWRLQGFPDWAFDRALAAGISNSRLYQQAGNSVTVNVILAIGVILKEIEDEDPYE